MTAPIRHPAPAGELRLEYPGQCWVWAVRGECVTSRGSPEKWPPVFYCHWVSDFGARLVVQPLLWHAIYTRGPCPPWPERFDQRDPGDETPDGAVATFILAETGGVSKTALLQIDDGKTETRILGVPEGRWCELVIAAREVAYGNDRTPEGFGRLDRALEPFAELVGWDETPKADGWITYTKQGGTK